MFGRTNVGRLSVNKKNTIITNFTRSSTNICLREQTLLEQIQKNLFLVINYRQQKCFFQLKSLKQIFKYYNFHSKSIARILDGRENVIRSKVMAPKRTFIYAWTSESRIEILIFCSSDWETTIALLLFNRFESSGQWEFFQWCYCNWPSDIWSNGNWRNGNQPCSDW